LAGAYSNCYADAFEEFYQQASDAFQAGDYGNAVILFNKAKKLRNNETHALDFNIGSSLYKWGKYISAYQSFELASESPKFYVLSHINMALCAANLNDRNLLAKHLIIVAPLVSDERHKRQLNNIATAFGLQAMLKTQSQQYLSSYIDLALGRQFKIVLQQFDPNSSTVTPANIEETDANYLYTGLNIDYHWQANFALRFNLQDVAYQSENAIVRKYSYRTIQLTPSYVFDSGHTLWSANLSAVHNDLANASLQNQTVVLLKAMAKRKTWRVGIYAQHRSIFVTDASYHYLQGEETTWGSQAIRHTSHWQMTVDASYSANNRSDFHSGSGASETIQSYSPLVQRLRLDNAYRFNNRNSANINLSYRYDRYPQLATSSARQDTNLSYGCGFTHRLNSHWQFLLNYQEVKNNSKLDLYSYHSQLVLFTSRYHW